MFLNILTSLLFEREWCLERVSKWLVLISEKRGKKCKEQTKRGKAE